MLVTTSTISSWNASSPKTAVHPSTSRALSAFVLELHLCQLDCPESSVGNILRCQNPFGMSQVSFVKLICSFLKCDTCNFIRLEYPQLFACLSNSFSNVFPRLITVLGKVVSCLAIWQVWFVVQYSLDKKIIKPTKVLDVNSVPNLFYHQSGKQKSG